MDSIFGKIQNFIIHYIGKIQNFIIHYRICSVFHGSASNPPVAAAVTAVARMAELEFVVAAIAGKVHSIGFEPGAN